MADDRIRLKVGDTAWTFYKEGLYVVRVTDVRIICEGERYEFASYKVESGRYGVPNDVSFHSSDLFKVPEEHALLSEALDDLRKECKDWKEAVEDFICGENDHVEQEPDEPRLRQFEATPVPKPVFTQQVMVVEGVRVIDVEPNPLETERIEAEYQQKVAAAEDDRQRRFQAVHSLWEMQHAKWKETELERVRAKPMPELGRVYNERY